jgi:peptidoglycan/xylan/chitin deacetylase (PgdA/CDA1 family)
LDSGLTTVMDDSALPYLAKAAVTRGRSLAWRVRARERPGMRILLYHRVADDDDELAVSPRAFARQMDRLAADGYRVVDVTEAAGLLEAGETGRTIGMTFDDGFADVAEHALPALERHGFRATVYVTTAVTGGSASFPWYRGRQPAVMGWDDVVALDRGGTLRFEAHTISHPTLPELDEAAAAHEITRSGRELADRLGRPVTGFAYPSGVFGERERRLVAAAGYATAVSCEPGVNTAATDRLALRRRQIDRRDGMLDFVAKVRGGHDTPPPLRRTWRRLRYGDRR